MEIGDVRIRLVHRADGILRAVASITIDDCFVVHDIKIFERDGETYIAMPNRRTSDGDFKDIAHPINSATRERLRDIILRHYAIAKAQAATD